MPSKSSEMKRTVFVSDPTIVSRTATRSPALNVQFVVHGPLTVPAVLLTTLGAERRFWVMLYTVYVWLSPAARATLLCTAMRCSVAAEGMMNAASIATVVHSTPRSVGPQNELFPGAL